MINCIKLATCINFTGHNGIATIRILQAKKFFSCMGMEVPAKYKTSFARLLYM